MTLETMGEEGDRKRGDPTVPLGSLSIFNLFLFFFIGLCLKRQSWHMRSTVAQHTNLFFSFLSKLPQDTGFLPHPSPLFLQKPCLADVRKVSGRTQATFNLCTASLLSKEVVSLKGVRLKRSGSPFSFLVLVRT